MATPLPFDTSWYLRQNPDVADAVRAGVVQAESHFEQHGRTEGRSPSPLFSAASYLARYPDVAQAVKAATTTAWDHFVEYGAHEGRDPGPLFDSNFYLLRNPDVAQAVQNGWFGSALEHFIRFGQHELRAMNPVIDLGKYAAANPDVAQAAQEGIVAVFDHLIEHGVVEGRDLGNGISLSDFRDDPVFSQALGMGDIAQALARVEQVAPFIPEFEVAWRAVVIDKDTTWPSGAIATLYNDVTIAPGVTLTIEPGVTINGNGYTISVHGTLDARATKNDKIVLNELRLSLSDNYATPGHIRLEHAQANGGRYLEDDYGSFSISHSHFNRLGYFYASDLTGPSVLSHNVFENSATLGLVHMSPHTLDVVNNAFINQYDSALMIVNDNYGSVRVTQNSFLSTDRIAIEIPYWMSSPLQASNNYFGTTDRAIIDSMIRDSGRPAGRAPSIIIDPILSAPHPENPAAGIRLTGQGLQYDAAGPDTLLGYSIQQPDDWF